MKQKDMLWDERDKCICRHSIYKHDFSNHGRCIADCDCESFTSQINERQFLEELNRKRKVEIRENVTKEKVKRWTNLS